MIGAALAAAVVDPEELVSVTITDFRPPIVVKPLPLILDGFMPGDVVRFAGVYVRHPATHEPLRFLQNFVVTGPDEVFPAAITSGPYANVTRKPAGKPTAFGSIKNKIPVDNLRGLGEKI